MSRAPYKLATDLFSRAEITFASHDRRLRDSHSALSCSPRNEKASVELFHELRGLYVPREQVLLRDPG
jgi:hypothetical protein